MKRTDEELMKRTLEIIENNGIILLRKKRPSLPDGEMPDPDFDVYLHQHTEIAAGKDHARWCFRGNRRVAKEFYNLKLALTIAPLYDCTVVVVYLKRNREKN